MGVVLWVILMGSLLVDTLWKSILGEIQLSVSHGTFEAWLKPTELIDTNESNVRIAARNSFAVRQLETRYDGLIRQALEKNGIKAQKVTYEIKRSGKKTVINREITRQAPISERVQQLTAPQNILSRSNQDKKISLNPRYTFDNFIVGSSNDLAYATCQAVASHPGEKYNPLFLYGGVGLGKTHLMQATGNEIIKNNPQAQILYTTTENFIKDFLDHIRFKKQGFSSKYRNVDVLIVDDVQFIAGKEKTQEEFFHTFNEIHAKNGQIVMTSDRQPKLLKGFEDRLRTRFEWGIIADITPPELDTKIAIINKKCEFDKIYLGTDVINYIATNMGDNIREIESAIINLNAYARLMRQEITLEFAKNILRDQIKEKRENINLESIVETVSKELNIKPSDMKSKSRSKNIVEARRIVIYLAKNLTPNSMPQIAQFFNMKDHSAVSHSIKKINELIETNEYFKVRVEELKNKILTKE